MQDPLRRKLTTILAADAVGYSQLMAIDEEGTLDTLRAYLDLTQALVKKHNGRVFNTAGDAFLAEFGSAVEAVRCAISLQEDLAARNAERPQERQMWFRIGINVGDVMVENGDLFGDGVNVAARLEGLADKGGICISGSTFQQVRNKLSVAFDDIGAHRVKNIPEPIPAFRIVPGSVSVRGLGRSTLGAARSGLQASGARRTVLAGTGLVAVGLAGAYLGGAFSSITAPDHPFDGRWQVTLSELSGCRDNSSRSYSIEVRGGKIDATHHRFPKTGDVSKAGELSIRVVDQTGHLMATQLAKIVGDAGEGSIQGSRPGCTGKIKVARLVQRP